MHIEKKGNDATIEKMSFNDAWQFPIVAGITLCGLYFSIQYFGKETVNYFLLCYIAIGGTTGIKSMVQSFTGNTFDSIDKDLLIDFSIKMIDLEVQVTQLDIYCLFISAI